MSLRPRRKISADKELANVRVANNHRRLNQIVGCVSWLLKDKSRHARLFAPIAGIGYIDYDSNLGEGACVSAAPRSILQAIKDEPT